MATFKWQIMANRSWSSDSTTLKFEANGRIGTKTRLLVKSIVALKED